MKITELQTRSKESEREYLKRSASEKWERYKPFAPPGDFFLTDGVDMIQDFACALKHLNPQQDDLILDLGAGPCWVSEWLQRLNLRSVAVDISLDMLRVGRQRLPEGNVTVGDMEELPFASETFDKVICLNSIHHIPNIRKAVFEVSRVLKKDGVALFSEPGKGHSKEPQSLAAMRDFGVLEQDVLIPKFLEYCEQAGFAELSIRPLSYALPNVSISANDWPKWRSYWLQYRPLRALQKFYRDTLEFFGLGKKGLLQFDFHAVTLMRVLTNAMETHPILVAYKKAVSRDEKDEYNALIKILEAPSVTQEAREILIQLQLENRGQLTWLAEPSHNRPFVQLGIQLLDADQKLLEKDYFRQRLPTSMPPESKQRLTFKIPMIKTSGKHFLKFDLVHEGVTWFELKGSPVVVHPIETR
jgi:ubiquinone/menaquinone biosynthesis C-methylase UbiE